MKFCKTCGETKPLDAFTTNRHMKDGKASKCRPCAAAYEETRAAYKAQWYVDNIRSNTAYRREYYRENAETAKKREEDRRRARGVVAWDEFYGALREDRARRHAEPLPETRQCRVCGEDQPIEEFSRSNALVGGRMHRCKTCASMQKGKWAELNAEHLAAYAKQYDQAHPEVWQATAGRRRARKLNAPGEDYTAEQAQQLWRAQGGVCANVYCFKLIDHKTRHLDHIMPLARGGSNSIDNLQWLCAKCNQQKHAKTPDEWWAWLAKKHAPK